MTDLCLHVQPDRAPELDMAQLRAACAALAATDLVERFSAYDGEDGGPYVNVMFATPDVRALWAALSLRLYGDPKLGPPLSRAAIATCEGAHGWDDYRLLAHLDPEVETERLAEDTIGRLNQVAAPSRTNIWRAVFSASSSVTATCRVPTPQRRHGDGGQ